MANKKTAKNLALLAIFSAAIAGAVVLQVPTITGQAVQDVIDSKGISAALTIILATAALAGMTAYTGMYAYCRKDPLERYSMHSRYWQGVAVQKNKWTRKHKEKTKVEIRDETEKHAANSACAPQDRPNHRPRNPKQDRRTKQAKEASQFEGLSEEMRHLNQEPVKENPEDDGKTGILPKPAENKFPDTNTGTEEDNKEPTPKNREQECRASDIQPTENAEKKDSPPAPDDGKRLFIKRFGTEDPLKIAERILERKGGK